ncbi:MAG: hypothetical protein R3Y13_02235 [bacterium]
MKEQNKITIDQEEFDKLICEAKNKENTSEIMFNLALEYSNTEINFRLIEDFFIDKKDIDYLIELYSLASDDQLEEERTLQKLLDTNDDMLIESLTKLNWLFTNKFIEKLLNK